MSSTIPSTPAIEETPYSKFAQERSHNDAKGLVEYGKTLIQLMIGINGLAATALITLAAATKEEAINQVGPLVPAIVWYLVGVFLGILAAASLYTSAQFWTMRWEQAAYSNMSKATVYSRWGLRYHWGAIILSVLGLIAFLGGGAAAASHLLQKSKSQVLSSDITITGMLKKLPKAGEKLTLTCTLRAEGPPTLDCE
jgi:hypothetical protein